MLVAFCLSPFLFFGALDAKGKEELAVVNARTIGVAIQAYHRTEKRWPIQLFDVAHFFEDGKKALLDPWGKPYQYLLGRDEKGNAVPHVWTEREVDGKLKVYGNKPADEKDEAAKEKAATEGAKHVVRALDVYWTGNGQAPKKLEDIAPLLKNGKKDLVDPWGKEYQFKVVIGIGPNGLRSARNYAWTERGAGKDTKVYGEKPLEEKK